MRAISRNLGKIAAPFVLALLCLGCGESPPPFQTVPMESPDRFAGQWFDREGHLTAEVSGGDKSRFSVRLDPRFKLLDARAQGSRLLFRIQTKANTATVLGVLSFVGEDRGVINDLLPARVAYKKTHDAVFDGLARIL